MNNDLKLPVVIVVRDFNEIEEQRLSVLIAQLPQLCREKVLSMRFSSDRRQILAAQLTWLYGLKLMAIDFQPVHYGQWGKPYLLYSPLNFNISHTANCVAVAFDNMAIGVDVERIDDIELELAENYFSLSEKLDLLAKPVCEQKKYFFYLWTLKEAYIKADGRGLAIPLQSFSFRQSKGKVVFSKRREWLFQSKLLGEDCYLAICRAHKRPPVQIEQRSIFTIISELGIELNVKSCCF